MEYYHTPYVGMAAACALYKIISLVPSHPRPSGEERLVAWFEFLVSNTFLIWNLRWRIESLKASLNVRDVTELPQFQITSYGCYRKRWLLVTSRPSQTLKGMVLQQYCITPSAARVGSSRSRLARETNQSNTSTTEWLDTLSLPADASASSLTPRRYRKYRKERSVFDHCILGMQTPCNY